MHSWLLKILSQDNDSVGLLTINEQAECKKILVLMQHYSTNMLRFNLNSEGQFSKIYCLQILLK
jgi:hypothetical protein